MRPIAILTTLLVLAWLNAMGQETAPIQLKLDNHALTERLLQPIVPQPAMPMSGMMAKPDLTQPIKLDWRMARLGDSLRLHDRMNIDYGFPRTSANDYNFVMDPYSRNWASSGIIATIGTGYLAGSGSFTAMPALGNVGSANVSFTQPIGERLLVTAGLSGNKYHFGREIWNDYGIYGRASFTLNERLSLNAFGQYYRDQRFHSVAALPYVQDTRYGGTLGIKMSDTFSLDMGAQRYYDPYTRQWKTVPIIAPTLNVMGQPISMDVGGLLYQILDNILGTKHDYGNYGNTGPDLLKGPKPAGFNPNSPVRIPDALR